MNNAGRINYVNVSAGNVPFKIEDGAAHNLLRVGVVAADMVDINCNLVITGTCTSQATDCATDYVFHPGYRLESIEEHAASMWERSYLPAVGPTPDNNGEGGPVKINVLQKTAGVLNELEKAPYLHRPAQRTSEV